jgi:Ion channel
VSYSSIYVHGLYFIVNTVSHVTIGDISMVTPEERFFNAWLILAGTFIYCYLFGNIASIVSDLAPNIFMNFHEKY